MRRGDKLKCAASVAVFPMIRFRLFILAERRAIHSFYANGAEIENVTDVTSLPPRAPSPTLQPCPEGTGLFLRRSCPFFNHVTCRILRARATQRRGLYSLVTGTCSYLTANIEPKIRLSVCLSETVETLETLARVPFQYYIYIYK